MELEADIRVIVQRSAHRVIGCLLGALIGLACLAVVGSDFVLWVLLLATGVWLWLANPDRHHGDQLCRNTGDVRVRNEHGPEPRPTAFDQPRLGAPGRGGGRAVFDVCDHTYTFANPYFRASEILGGQRLKSCTDDDVLRPPSMSSKAGFRRTGINNRRDHSVNLISVVPTAVTVGVN